MKRIITTTLLSGAASLLAVAPLPAWAQESDVLEQEAKSVRERLRFVREMEGWLREAEADRLRGACGSVARFDEMFQKFTASPGSWATEMLADFKRRMREIALRDCPPDSGKPSIALAPTPPEPQPTPAPPVVVPVPPAPVGSAGTTGGTQPPAGTGQAPPPTGAEPTASEPFENIMDEIDEQDRLEWERRKAARDARLKAEAAASESAPAPPPKPAASGGQAQGLSAAEETALAANIEEGAAVEQTVRDLENDDFLSWESRIYIGRRFRESVLNDKRFSPDAIERWVERIDGVLEKAPPEAKAAADKPLGPVRSTTLPMEFPPMPKPAPSTGPQSSLPKDRGVGLNPQEQQFLALHNQARAEVGVKPLQWDPALAAGAKVYAIKLTSAGQLVHSSREGRKTVRENLLQSLPGGRTPTQMIGVWTAEKSKFKPGIFPEVSTTGNWVDIGHYTQMVWETTTHVGCAINGDARFEWLVCHYSPPGNRDGTAIGMPKMPQPRHVVASTPTMPQLRGVAGQDGIAPANSTTTTGPPPPPPPPTARDDSPDGDEARHPLNGYFAEALARHTAAVDCGDKAAAAAEMAKMRYALDELKKRLKAAKKAGPYSAVKPDDVQKQIDDMEARIRSAELRPGPGACPPMPQPRGVAGQTR